VVQINGQKKAIISVNKDTNQSEVEKISKNVSAIRQTLIGKEISKTIFIKNKLINFVV